jgi:hypothetical protein
VCGVGARRDVARGGRLGQRGSSGGAARCSGRGLARASSGRQQRRRPRRRRWIRRRIRRRRTARRRKEQRRRRRTRTKFDFFFFFFLLLLLLLLVCSSFLADTFAQSELSNFAARALQDAIRECLQGIFSGVQGGSQITAGSVSEAQCQTAMDCLKGIASKQIAGLGIYDSVFGVDPVQRQMQAQKAAREMMDKATTSRNPCAEKPKVASVNSPKLPPLPGVKE